VNKWKTVGFAALNPPYGFLVPRPDEANFITGAALPVDGGMSVKVG